MAGFRTHIAVSTACGVAAGVTTAIPLKHSPETAFLVGTLTAVGGCCRIWTPTPACRCGS